MRVGFLGLGVMGKAMASHLLKQGVEVAVWNRTSSKCADLVAAGATMCASPAAVVEGASVTHGMLSDPAASEQVVFGESGVLSAVRPGRAYIDHSTVDEESGARISDALSEKGARFLAAPVSGGWRDAAKGELLFLCGGDRSLFDESTAEGAGIAVMGSNHWFVGGSPELAARSKLMLQIMMGSMVGALAETLALSEKAGLDPSQVLEMFNRSAMANPISAAKGKMMVSQKFFPTPPNFQTYLQQKDLRLALELADRLAMPAPIASAVNSQYVAARQRGYAAADFAAVRAVYNERGEDPALQGLELEQRRARLQ
jgi:glyoxylate/succinic semialdehyde reductase